MRAADRHSRDAKRGAALREALLARERVYQREAKVACARALGEPDDAFYNLPYEAWAAIRDGRGADALGYHPVTGGDRDREED